MGRIWRFAGLDPTVEWTKGEAPVERRTEASLLEDRRSFVKMSGRRTTSTAGCTRSGSSIEQERNEAGKFADQAATKLERFKIGKSTDAYNWYSQGKLPPAPRPRPREAVGSEALPGPLPPRRLEAGHRQEPPKPYVIAILEHADFIMPPNFPVKEAA